MVWEAICTGEPFPGEVIASAPHAFAVQGVYPNPFNPTTTLSFTLPEAGPVKLTIYDVNGRAVTQLVNGMRDAGAHEVTFDGSGLASGIYLYTLTAGSHSVAGKMMLVK